MSSIGSSGGLRRSLRSGLPILLGPLLDIGHGASAVLVAAMARVRETSWGFGIYPEAGEAFDLDALEELEALELIEKRADGELDQ